MARGKFPGVGKRHAPEIRAALGDTAGCADCQEITARLRDVAAAQGDSAEWITWEAMAESAESEMFRDGAYTAEWLLQAIYYRGLLSLCEAED